MREQRKHHYNDHRLQGLLISVLIIIELLLVIALLVYLFAEFNRVIDGRLYRIHGGHAQSWPEFISLLAGAVGAFLLLNTMLLFLAHLVWDRYVARTVEQFSNGLERMGGLDFSADGESSAGQHRIIKLLAAWRDKERQRNTGITLLVDRLAKLEARSTDTQTRAEWQQILQEYRRLLSAHDSSTERP